MATPDPSGKKKPNEDTAVLEAQLNALDGMSQSQLEQSLQDTGELKIELAPETSSTGALTTSGLPPANLNPQLVDKKKEPTLEQKAAAAFSRRFKIGDKQHFLDMRGEGSGEDARYVFVIDKDVGQAPLLQQLARLGVAQEDYKKRKDKDGGPDKEAPVKVHTTFQRWKMPKAVFIEILKGRGIPEANIPQVLGDQKELQKAINTYGLVEQKDPPYKPPYIGEYLGKGSPNPPKPPENPRILRFPNHWMSNAAVTVKGEDVYIDLIPGFMSPREFAGKYAPDIAVKRYGDWQVSIAEALVKELFSGKSMGK